MSIVLKSIELSNIRSHTHSTFEPADSGITAISGPTGAGKSTIVDSIAWTLFGTKPNGVSKTSAIFRSGADFKEDKCFAVVQMSIDGVLFKIKRKMVTKAGAIECDIYEYNEEEKDWVHRAGPGVSHAEKYIRQTLKMDEKGFLTAVLVQQKQVDQLISATPAIRAQVIEKLTGISSITAGIQDARQEHNTLRRSAKMSSVDETQLDAAKVELTSNRKTLKKLGEQHVSLKEEVELAKNSGAELRIQVDEETEKSERLSAARNRDFELKVEIKSKEESLVELTNEKDRLKKLTSAKTVGISFEDSLEKVETLSRSVSRNELKRTNAEKTVKTASKKIEEAEKIIKDSDLNSASAVKKKINSVVKLLEKSTEKKEKINSENSQIDGEVSQLEAAIEVVSSGDCPTCLQHVDDSHAAVKSLKATIAKLQKSRDKNIKAIETEQNLLAENSQKKSELDGQLEAFESLQSLMSEKSEAEKSIIDLDEMIKTEKAELKVAEKMHRAIESEAENARLYNSALKKVQAAISAIDSLKGEQNEVQEIISSTGAVSEAKLKKMRTKLETLREEFITKKNRLKDITHQAQLTKQQISHLRENIARFEKEIQDHKDLLKSVEISSATVHILEEFKANRMKTTLPTIESYASELLSRFTEGRFTRLQLDEKFNASVTLADGTVRPVGLLSGGELSAASIALRLSVSMLLNSSGNNMIILDEVLVSQDADRSELILSTVKDVCKGQVIMIAHNESVDSIADKTVQILPSA